MPAELQAARFCYGVVLNSSGLKIIHCPTSVGGHPQELSRSESRLGANSISAVFEQNYLDYKVDKVIYSGRRWLREFERWSFVMKVMCSFNVVHYNYGSCLSPGAGVATPRGLSAKLRRLGRRLYAGIFAFIDVRMAKMMGKVIAVTYQGSDARQGDFCRNNYPIHFVHSEAPIYCAASDALKRKCIARFDKCADLIYALNPDILNVLPKRAKFLPYAHVNVKEIEPCWVDEGGAAVPHLVHAPSNRGIKGSRFVLEAIERLKSDGIEFRVTLVEGLPNSEAKKVYETADLVVDQLLAGFYGGLSVEVMALGKPVVCYIRESDMVHLPAEMYDQMPIIQATPESVYSVLKEWLTSRKSELRAVGMRSRSYVEAWHDSDRIAVQTVNDYLNVFASRGK